MAVYTRPRSYVYLAPLHSFAPAWSLRLDKWLRPPLLATPQTTRNAFQNTARTDRLHRSRTGDVVFVEEATYFLATQMLGKDFRMKLVPIKCDRVRLVPADLCSFVRRGRRGPMLTTHTRRAGRQEGFVMSSFETELAIFTEDRKLNAMAAGSKFGVGGGGGGGSGGTGEFRALVYASAAQRAVHVAR